MSKMQSLLRLVGTDKTPDERAICRAALLSILRGEAIDRTGLMAATGFSGERTEALLEALTMRGLLVLEEESGRVLGSWGLSLCPPITDCASGVGAIHVVCHGRGRHPGRLGRECKHRIALPRVWHAGKHRDGHGQLLAWNRSICRCG